MKPFRALLSVLETYHHLDEAEPLLDVNMQMEGNVFMALIIDHFQESKVGIKRSSLHIPFHLNDD